MDGNDQELPSTTLVIFGISGDLAHRYLLPALAEICRISAFRTQLKILGLSRRPISASAVLTQTTNSLKSQLRVLQIDYDQPDQYQKLKDKLQGLDSEQIIFYFAVPPEAVLPIVSNLGKAGLNSSEYRLLMEKPFGTDLPSAKKLVRQTQKYFSEDQVYRIDHYLAKEMVQNIAVFLGSNALFRHVWNRRFVEYIEVVVAEEIGVQGRAGFYEQTGALRDMVQSHLLQLVVLTLMEPCPHDFDFADLPARRLAALKQITIDKDKLADTLSAGQYKAYRREVGNPRSEIETFVALRLRSADPRWRGVPIYLASGKKLNQKLTQIHVNFKKDNNSEANTLVIRIQPHEGIELDLWVKRPGYERRLQKKTLGFSYQQGFDGRLPDAYEQILVDAMRGSHSLFAGSEEVVQSWRILQPVLNYWSQQGKNLKIYKPGSTVEAMLPNP